MNGKRKRQRSSNGNRFALLFLFALFSLIWAFSAEATTYYISPSGSDSAAGSATAPWATFGKAWGVLNPGDTLIVKDGTYNQNAAPPAGKSGAAGNLITVQAQNDGLAHITQAVSFRNNSYVAFIGVKITGSNNAVEVGSNGTGFMSHHLNFQRIGFNCTVTNNDGACFSLGDGTHHILLEDSWGWGGGRYTVLAYGGPGGNPPNTTCDYNTFRRLVLREGPNISSSGNPQAGLSLYYASNNIVENVIVLDSVPASDSSNAAFYLTGHEPPPNTSSNRFYGVLALNNLGVGWYLDHNGTGSNNELRNSVIWDSTVGGIALYAAGTCASNLVDHVISGAHTGSGLENYCDATSVKSSIFVNNSQYGMRQGSGQGSIAASNWNDFYNNASGARLNVSAGANDKTANPALLYLVRIETGSACVGGGEAGTNCGADLTKRYQDGTITPTPLWPWPNEDRIKKEMCTDAGVTRGFCGAQTLTKYIWEYLGNPIPPEIYGGSPPPAAPANLRIR
jgi:hypothetical protein